MDGDSMRSFSTAGDRTTTKSLSIKWSVLAHKTGPIYPEARMI